MLHYRDDSALQRLSQRRPAGGAAVQREAERVPAATGKMAALTSLTQVKMRLFTFDLPELAFFRCDAAFCWCWSGSVSADPHRRSARAGARGSNWACWYR